MGNDSIIAFKYAIADGLRWLFVRHGKGSGYCRIMKEIGRPPKAENLLSSPAEP